MNCSDENLENKSVEFLKRHEVELQTDIIIDTNYFFECNSDSDLWSEKITRRVYQLNQVKRHLFKHKHGYFQ